jgi:hypothetical protein
MRIDLDFAEGAAGMTGALTGDVTVISPSGFTWSAEDCAFTIARWEGERAAGTGACAMPASPETGSGDVLVGDFAFDLL